MDFNIRGWSSEALFKMLTEKQSLPPTPIRLETIEAIKNELEIRKNEKKVLDNS
jgi:hypothetical protein